MKMTHVDTSEILHSFVYCSWDNVVGPKVIKTWFVSEFQREENNVDEVGIEIVEDTQNPTNRDLRGEIREDKKLQNQIQVDSDMVGVCCTEVNEEDKVSKYLAVHTLTGHLAKSKYSNDDIINEISLVVPALKFISQTATFYSQLLSENVSENYGFVCEPVMNSLSIVFNYNYQNSFWNLHPVLIHLLERTAERLRVGLSQDINYQENPIVFKWLQEINRNVTATVNLPLSSKPFPTNSIPMKRILNQYQLAWDVIITALLTTSGSFCVVGKHESFINQVIDFLALFLPEKQQSLCSRYASNTFCCGLYLQGLLEKATGSRNIKSSDILLNQLPLALLDLSKNGTIKFSGYLHEHHRNKQRQCRQEELNIIQRKQHEIPFTTESVFRSFGGSSRYVRWCLEQLQTHNTEHWTRIISAFHQALALQANDFIKEFQSKNLQQEKDLRLVCSLLKKSMNITDPDLWLLAATAERLKPGFCQAFARIK